MKRVFHALLLFMITALFYSTASATPVLYDWAFNIDGTITTAPADYDTSGMPVAGALGTNDLGTLTYTTSVAGAHSFLAFFDYEIDEATTTFFNEYGATFNSPEATQSWEIDEPGYVFGDIYDNFENNTLDNTNAITSAAPDDVSWAMGWDFNLAAGEKATISLVFTDLAPLSPFVLKQTDDVTGESIYFYSTLEIRGDGVIPEPGTFLLLGTGLLGLTAVGRRKRSRI